MNLKLVLFFWLLVLVSSSSVFAQDGPEPPPSWEEDGPDPPPAAPINKALPLLVIVGIGFAYRIYKEN